MNLITLEDLKNRVEVLDVDFKIETQADFDNLVQSVAIMKGEAKRMEDEKKEAESEYKNELKKINKKYGLLKKIQALEGRAKGSIVSYWKRARHQIELKRAENKTTARLKKAEVIRNLKTDLELAQSEQEKNDIQQRIDTLFVAPDAVLEPTKPKPLTMKETATFRVLDIDKVPRKFLKIDERAVMDHIKKGETFHKLDGLEVIKKYTPCISVGLKNE